MSSVDAHILTLFNLTLNLFAATRSDKQPGLSFGQKQFRNKQMTVYARGVNNPPHNVGHTILKHA